MAALFALIVAMFALAPIVEAAECGVELPSAHQILAGDVDGDHDQGRQPMHGACSHGHCHHSGSVVTPDLTSATKAADLRADHAFPLDDLRVSYAPDGLERPPRG
ncbi:MAG: hypothetical protein ACK4NU_04590 [Brevundimonas sp.]